MNQGIFKAIIEDHNYSFEKDHASTLDVIRINANNYHLIHQKQSYQIELIGLDLKTQQVQMLVNGQAISVQIEDERMDLIKELGFDLETKKKIDEILAPMPGLVVDVLVKVGDKVKEGDPILILEAMKMENIIHAPCDAEIIEINISKEDKVEKSEKLVQLK